MENFFFCAVCIQFHLVLLKTFYEGFANFCEGFYNTFCIMSNLEACVIICVTSKICVLHDKEHVTDIDIESKWV